MTPADFAAWLALMKERGLSANACAKKMGWSDNQPRRYLATGAPPHVAYACAALAYGLPPWRLTDR